jgi:hypothetical protein
VAARGLVFFAAKTRIHPKYRNDGVTGYFANTQVTALCTIADHRTRLSLVSGHTVDLAMTRENVMRRMADAEAFQNRLHRQRVF